MSFVIRFVFSFSTVDEQSNHRTNYDDDESEVNQPEQARRKSMPAVSGAGNVSDSYRYCIWLCTWLAKQMQKSKLTKKKKREREKRSNSPSAPLWQGAIERFRTDGVSYPLAIRHHRLRAFPATNHGCHYGGAVRRAGYTRRAWTVGNVGTHDCSASQTGHSQ